MGTLMISIIFALILMRASSIYAKFAGKCTTSDSAVSSDGFRKVRLLALKKA